MPNPLRNPRDHALGGFLGSLALVLVFLFLFLSARTAFWVAIGIPAAMAATLGLMFVFGMTLNMISLFALIICLGVVVDDAIVVGEHADFLARRRGLPPDEAAISAARRMAAPVFSASITTVIAFMALIFVIDPRPNIAAMGRSAFVGPAAKYR